MSALRFIAGNPAYYNVLARGVLSSSSADALYPLANVKDGDPAKPFMFAATGADLWVKVDTSLLVGSNFDLWSAGSPVGWSKILSGAGTVTQDAVIMVSGSSAALNQPAGVDIASVFQDVTVRAGDWHKFDAFVRVGAGPTAEMTIRNLHTGNYLTPTVTWSATPQAALTQTNTAGLFANKIATFQTEDYGTVGEDTCTLRITLSQTGAGLSWFDNAYLYPGVDFFSIHGHNLNARIPVVLESSPDDAAWSTQITATSKKPAFAGISAAAPTFARYWRVRYSGTPLARIFYGEVVVGQLASALRSHLYGWPTTFIFDQLRMETENGHVQTFKQAQFERRAVKLEFQVGAQNEFEQLRDAWTRRSFGGHYPMIVVPDDADAALVFQGRMTSELEVLKHFLAVWSTDIVFAESAFPTITG